MPDPSGQELLDVAEGADPERQGTGEPVGVDLAQVTATLGPTGPQGGGQGGHGRVWSGSMRARTWARSRVPAGAAEGILGGGQLVPDRAGDGRERGQGGPAHLGQVQGLPEAGQGGDRRGAGVVACGAGRPLRPPPPAAGTRLGPLQAHRRLLQVRTRVEPLRGDLHVGGHLGDPLPVPVRRHQAVEDPVHRRPGGLHPRPRLRVPLVGPVVDRQGEPLPQPAGQPRGAGPAAEQDRIRTGDPFQQAREHVGRLGRAGRQQHPLAPGDGIEGHGGGGVALARARRSRHHHQGLAARPGAPPAPGRRRAPAVW